MLYEIFGSVEMSAVDFYGSLWVLGVIIGYSLVLASKAFLYCKWWVDDKEGECLELSEVLGSWCSVDSDDATCLLAFGPVIWALPLILADIFPLLIPITALFFGGLFGLRGFVRFKKKVDKALEVGND